MPARAALTLGVLGGQGALASATFVWRLMKAWPLAYRCELDSDFPRLIHISEALPGLGPGGLESSAVALPFLKSRAQALRSQGVALIVLPCNSLEPLAPAVAAACGVRVLTPLAAARAIRAHQALVALGSSSTAAALSQEPGGAWGAVGPALQREIDRIIQETLCGHLHIAQVRLNSVLARVQAQGRIALLACTELSCLQAPDALDAMDDLVTYTIQLALNDGDL